MKKILSLGVAAAVVSMTAIAASATVKPELIDGDYTEGSTVTIELKAFDLDSVEFGCNVAVEGLELVEDGIEYGVGNGLYNAETGIFGWYDMTAPENGDTLVTLTYNVTAAAGEKVSLALTPVEGYEGFVDAIDNIEAEVIEVTTGGEELGGEEGGEELGGEEGGEELGGDDAGSTEGGDDAGSTEGGDDENKAENPDTGIALAVVPAVLAGAAIVVSKKRK